MTVLHCSRLDDFQRHRLRVWGIYTLGMGAFGDLGIGGFWRYDSAENYSLASSSFRVTDEQQAILDERGYVDGPSSRTLYYSGGADPNCTTAPAGSNCQGRSKIRPPWRRKTRPLGRWVEWRNAAVRRGRQDAGVAAGWRAFLLCSRR